MHLVRTLLMWQLMKNNLSESKAPKRKPILWRLGQGPNGLHKAPHPKKVNRAFKPGSNICVWTSFGYVYLFVLFVFDTSNMKYLRVIFNLYDTEELKDFTICECYFLGENTNILFSILKKKMNRVLEFLFIAFFVTITLIT